MGFSTHHTSSQNRATANSCLAMMKLVLALTAFIAVAQALPRLRQDENKMGMGPPPMGPPPMSMGPMGPGPMEMMMAEEMMAEEMMVEAEVEAEVEAAMMFCADVAKGKDEEAMKFVDAALAFQCGEKGTKAGCDELTKDKEAGLAVVAEKLGCKSPEAPSE